MLVQTILPVIQGWKMLQLSKRSKQVVEEEGKDSTDAVEPSNKIQERSEEDRVIAETALLRETSIANQRPLKKTSISSE
ncbi:hypothetical protein Tco_0730194 [Tanacetum coccineum]|uniref:Uncharacterized protein n=1 Tax=Tanacetum coccineum TaxID=301880 RepID=A0ABQ4YU63_9ASTR